MAAKADNENGGLSALLPSVLLSNAIRFRPSGLRRSGWGTVFGDLLVGLVFALWRGGRLSWAGSPPYACTATAA